jgi:hypothetical protein
MTDSAGGVGSNSCSMSSSQNGGLSDNPASFGSHATRGGFTPDTPTTEDRLASGASTEDNLKNSQTALDALRDSPTTAERLSSNPDTTPNPQSSTKQDRAKDITTKGDIAGYVATLSTSAVTAKASQVQQESIRGPVEHAIESLEASKDPVQMEKAQALREANRPGGLKGAIHPEAVEYNVEKTLSARNQVLSENSVIGNKLTNDLRKASKTIDLAESIGKKAGVVGLVAGPVIGTVTEIAKLDEHATTADKITAGFVGALKTVDNAAIGATAGLVSGIVAAPTGPGAVAVGTAAGIAADETYKALGGDKQFDGFIDDAVAPLIHSGVELGLETFDATREFVTDALEESVDTVSSAVETIENAVDDVTTRIETTTTEYYNSWMGENQ